MAGKVRAATPWGREAIRQFGHRYPDALEAIEDAIPDGCSITVTVAGNHRQYGASLMRGEVEVARIYSADADHRTVMAACYAVLLAARENVA